MHVHSTIKTLHTATIKNKTKNVQDFNEGILPASQHAITKRIEI